MGVNTGVPRNPDVLIIGGGIIGCTVALRLAQNHLRVWVLDRGEPGGEASSAAAGMIAPQGEMAEPDEFFWLCAASRDLYPSFVEEVEHLSGQRAGYRCEGTVLVAFEEQDCRELQESYQNQLRLGLPVERLTAKDVRERVPHVSPDAGCGLYVPGDHAVDNELLIAALVKACRQLGVSFYPRTAASKVNVRSDRVDSVQLSCEASAQAQGEPTISEISCVSAGQFILAAGCWSADLVEPLGIHLSTQPCRGQMMEFECPPGSPASAWPMVVRAGHHYLVPRSGGRVVAGSTMEYVGHRKAVTGAGLRSILEGARRITPLVESLQFRRAWSGLRPDTADHLPILGYGELRNLIFATGHFRNGILLAPITAQLISELLLASSVSHPIEAYRPARAVAD